MEEKTLPIAVWWTTMVAGGVGVMAALLAEAAPLALLGWLVTIAGVVGVVVTKRRNAGR